MTPARLLMLAAIAAFSACAGPTAEQRSDALSQAGLTLERGLYGQSLDLFDRAGSPPSDARVRARLERLRALSEALGEPWRRRLDSELLSPTPSSRYAHAAVAAYLGGEDRRAALLGAAAVGADPGSPFPRRLLAAFESTIGVVPAADELLRPELLALHLLDRAQLEYEAGRHARALAACEEALWIEPESAAAHERLGSIYFALDRRAKAEEHWARALELDPENAELRSFAARLEASER